MITDKRTFEVLKSLKHELNTQSWELNYWEKRHDPRATPVLDGKLIFSLLSQLRRCEVRGLIIGSIGKSTYLAHSKYKTFGREMKK